MTVGDGFRFGVGFVFASVIFGILAWILAIVVFGGLLLGLSSLRLPSATSGSSTFDGTGAARSEPFTLRGAADVTWSVTPAADGCSLRAELLPDGGSTTTASILEGSFLTPDSGSHQLAGLGDGRYVAIVESSPGCRWSFRFTPGE